MKAILNPLAVFLGVFVAVVGAIKLGPTILSIALRYMDRIYDWFSAAISGSMISKSEFSFALFMASVTMVAYLVANSAYRR